jgi:CRP-like cAMP-binding protein
MNSRASSNQPYRNRVLSSLLPDEIARLAPHLNMILLERNQPLLEDGQKVRDAYFLEEGVASMVVTTEDGKTAEAGIIGRCGMVGIPILLGTESMPGRTFIHMPGFGFRISADAVRDEFERPGEFRRLLLRYLQAQLIQSAQLIACNRLHDIQQRLARWLLLCRDRMDSDDLNVTHEFIGQMLGAPRTTVTLVMGMLQTSGLVGSSRGCISIANRKGLEDVACECYAVISGEYVRLSLHLGLTSDRQRSCDVA